MLKRLFKPAFVLLIAPTITTSALAKDMPGFSGRWVVVGVAVSDIGVQALVDNDPSLIGKRLTFTTRQLAWDQLPITKDICESPEFTRLSSRSEADLRPQLHKLGMHNIVAYRLRCRAGGWGPADRTILYRDINGAIAMLWYDGGLLKLARWPSG